MRTAGFRDGRLGVLIPNWALSKGLFAGQWSARVCPAPLAGLPLTAGVVPGVGSVLAGGTLSGLLRGAPKGIHPAGLRDVLVRRGLTEDQASACERQVRAGQILVLVESGRRLRNACEALSWSAPMPG